jgi:hypothetical protein
VEQHGVGREREMMGMDRDVESSMIMGRQRKVRSARLDSARLDATNPQPDTLQMNPDAPIDNPCTPSQSSHVRSPRRPHSCLFAPYGFPLSCVPNRSSAAPRLAAWCGLCTACTIARR